MGGPPVFPDEDDDPGALCRSGSLEAGAAIFVFILVILALVLT
jgi:hypothetical protein